MSAAVQWDEEQKEIVYSDKESIMVLAGAGTGKSTTLVGRLNYLTREAKTVNKAIVFTFTRSAKRDLIKKVKHLEEVKVKTIIDFSLRYLYHHGLLTRRTLEKTDWIMRLCLLEHIKEVKDELVRLFLALLEQVINWDKLREEISISSVWKMIRGTSTGSTISIDTAAEILENYYARLKVKNTIDYTGAIRQLIKHWSENEENVPDEYQATFVDEFQDITPLQFQLLSFFFRKSRFLFCVGDKHQNIFSFRGSDDTIFTDLQKMFKAQEYKLTCNYRSFLPILRPANKLLESLQSPIVLKSTKEGGLKPKILVHFSPEGRQSELLFDRIKQHLEDGYEPGEIAILYSCRSGLKFLISLLQKHNIPVNTDMLNKLLSKQLFKVFLRYIDFLNDPDFEKLQEIINYPPRGIGQVSFSKFKEFCKDFHITDIEEAMEKYGDPKFSSLLKQLKEIKKGEFYKKRNIGEFFQIVHWTRKIHDREIGEINDLLFEKILNPNVASEDPDKDILDFVEERNHPGITISTIHSAKGLEWKIVYIVGLEQWRLNWWNDIDQRRMIYVAITRAKQFLFLVEEGDSDTDLIDSISHFFEIEYDNWNPKTSIKRTIKLKYEKHKERLSKTGIVKEFNPKFRDWNKAVGVYLTKKGDQKELDSFEKKLPDLKDFWIKEVARLNLAGFKN